MSEYEQLDLLLTGLSVAATALLAGASVIVAVWATRIAKASHRREVRTAELEEREAERRRRQEFAVAFLDWAFDVRSSTPALVSGIDKIMSSNADRRRRDDEILNLAALYSDLDAAALPEWLLAVRKTNIQPQRLEVERVVGEWIEDPLPVAERLRHRIRTATPDSE